MLLNRMVNSAYFLNISTVVSSPFNFSKFYSTSNNSEEKIIDEATVYLQNRNSHIPNNVGNRNTHNRGLNRNMAQQSQPTGGYQQQYFHLQQNQRPNKQVQRNLQPLQQQMKSQPPPPAMMNQPPVLNQNIQPQQLTDLMMQHQIASIQNNMLQMMQLQLQNSMFQQQSATQLGGVSQVFSQQLTQQQVASLCNLVMQNQMNQQQQLPTLSASTTPAPVQSIPQPQQQPQMEKSPMASMISQWLSTQAQQRRQMAQINHAQQQQNNQYRPPSPQGPQKFTKVVLNEEHRMQNSSGVLKETPIAKGNEYIDEQEDFEVLPDFKKRAEKQVEKPKKEEKVATSTNTDKEEEKNDKNVEENDKSMGNAFLSGKMEASGTN